MQFQGSVDELLLCFLLKQVEMMGPKLKNKKNPDGYVDLPNGSLAFLGESRAVYTGDSVLIYWMNVLVVKMLRRKAILLQDDVPQVPPNSARMCL